MVFMRNPRSFFSSTSRKMITAAALVLGITTFAAIPADATILTFQVAGATNSDNQVLPQAYGDNVTGPLDADGNGYGVGDEGTTPDVTVSYGGPDETPRFRPDFVDDAFVHFNADEAGTTLTTTLTAAPGFNVVLYGFDLAASFATFNINGFTITDLATSQLLFSSGVIGLQAGVRDSFDFAAAPYTGSQLQILIDTTFDSPGIGSVSPGITDIRFSQVPINTNPPVGGIPEPASWALLVIGFGTTGAMLRRRPNRVPA